MKRPILTTEERMRRYQRDLEAYRRRSLWRRSHARFHRDLQLIPQIFLLPGRVQMAELLQPPEEVRAALRGRAVWTLDAAMRRVSGRGFLAAHDLTGYLQPATFEEAVATGRVGTPTTVGLSVDPLYRRPPVLIAHLVDELPLAVDLADGDQVVTQERLLADVMGTLGWRPEILTLVETFYHPASPAAAESALTR